MVKNAKPSFPWDQIKAETMRSLCRDLGLKQHSTTRSSMIDFLESVWRVGLPKALDNVSATTHTSTPSSVPRTSQKRGRDTPTTTSTVSTPLSSLNGDGPSPSKRHRRGPDIRSDYNTRFKADRRGQLSGSDTIIRRSTRRTANGMAIISAVDRPVRTSVKRRYSTPTRSSSRAGKRTFAAGRPGRRVTLGEPVASDVTSDYEQEDNGSEGTSISTVAVKTRRMTKFPTIIRTRRQKEEEESASAIVTRRGTRLSPSKRVMSNGVVHKDADYQPEQDEDEDDYEDEEEKPVRTRQSTRRSFSGIVPHRFHPRRRIPSASPPKPRAATASPRKSRASRITGTNRVLRARMGVPAKKSRGRRRPHVHSSVKLVFDGIDVPPMNAVWKRKKTSDETTGIVGYGDEDADGEVDEEVHPPSVVPIVNDENDVGGRDEGWVVVGSPKEGEEEEAVVTVESESGEAKEPPESGEPAEEQEAEDEEKAEVREPVEHEEAEEQEATGLLEVDGELQPEEQEQVGGVTEEQTREAEHHQQPEDDNEAMDQGEDELGGLIPDDISSLGNSNKENEAPEGHIEEVTETIIDAEMAAQTVLFGAPITVGSTRVEYIGDEDAGIEEMEDVQGIEGIEDIDNVDDDMQGPTAEDIRSFIV